MKEKRRSLWNEMKYWVTFTKDMIVDEFWCFLCGLKGFQCKNNLGSWFFQWSTYECILTDFFLKFIEQKIGLNFVYIKFTWVSNIKLFEERPEDVCIVMLFKLEVLFGVYWNFLI